ncbi:MAG TPA: hypothetical protein VG838_14645 [Opitutaceae bacterium]|nr:hypothetical protein [Opitutaceae bacterium]
MPSERRRRRDPRRDEMTRAMIACKAKLEEAAKMPDGPAKEAAQAAAIALLSKDAPKRPDRRKEKAQDPEVAKGGAELNDLVKRLFQP